MANDTTRKIYLFKGDKYIQIDQPSGTIEVQPASIADHWTGLADLQQGFESGLDAAAYVQGNRIVFFKDDHYAVFDAMAKRVLRNGNLADYVQPLPDDKTTRDGDFTQGIDAATCYSASQLYLFKGNHCVIGDPSDPDHVPVGALRTQDFGWPYPYTLGVQAAPTLDDNNAFIRGDSAYFYKGGIFTLECLWPGVRDIGFDAMIDAGVVVDWELEPPDVEPTDD